MATTLIGTPVSRVEGRKKVTGEAQYAGEIVLGEMTHAVLVGSAKAGGSIRSLDVKAASQAPGVLLVLTHLDKIKFGAMPNNLQAGGTTAEERDPLADNRILHNGQYVAMIVAEGLEQARHAASLLKIEYDAGKFAVGVEDAAESRFNPNDFMGEPLSVKRGDPEKGFKEADARIAGNYITPNEHPCALEPHATVASWAGGDLTVYNSTQWVMGDQKVLAGAFNLPLNKVRVLCPYTGGMFGSKGATGAHVLLAAHAARQLNRPVKIVLSRTQVLTDVGHRSETIQDIEIGAKRDGTLTAMRHKVTSHTSLEGEFTEAANLSSRMMYDVQNYEAEHSLVRLNIMRPSWMRAPGEMPGMYALECAMDELAYELDLDPVELRRRNHSAVNLSNGLPFSSKHLLECYGQGAERFGWARRNPQPGSMRDGDAMVGWGMAGSCFPGYIMGATMKVKLQNDASGVRAVVSTAGNDSGTGMYTMLAITAAEALGLPLEKVSVELGSTDLTPCAVAGGSNLTASSSPATQDACTEIKRELLKIAAKAADGFTGATLHEEEFVFSNGRVAHRTSPKNSIGYGDLLALAGRESIEANGETQPIFGHNKEYAFNSFGAQFVEVRVHPTIGRVRVSRVVSVFDVGRVLSAKTARSQLLGGVVFGIGSALLEELTYDRAHGQPINADLAGYLVPVNADIPEIDVSWIGEADFNFNSMGVRGLGEIGITGVAAAIANAVYHATGIRVRDLPITPDKLVRGLTQ